MTDEAREAAFAERERIARLAEQCGARYELDFRDAPFAGLIRSGKSRPPWAWSDVPDPLSDDSGRD
jgi:hypothetical protein